MADGGLDPKAVCMSRTYFCDFAGSSSSCGLPRLVVSRTGILSLGGKYAWGSAGGGRQESLTQSLMVLCIYPIIF